MVGARALRWGLLAAALWAPGLHAQTGEQHTAYVDMTEHLTFSPRSITIHPGETVVWRNRTTRTHTVTDDPSKVIIPGHTRLPEGAEPFDSGMIAPGQRWSHTFQVPGLYRYFCKPHELAGMIGEVVVQPR